jgi:hypothetical protein
MPKTVKWNANLSIVEDGASRPHPNRPGTNMPWSAPPISRTCGVSDREPPIPHPVSRPAGQQAWRRGPKQRRDGRPIIEHWCVWLASV